jgi:hypothetical protein
LIPEKLAALGFTLYEKDISSISALMKQNISDDSQNQEYDKGIGYDPEHSSSGDPDELLRKSADSFISAGHRQGGQHNSQSRVQEQPPRVTTIA